MTKLRCRSPVGIAVAAALGSFAAGVSDATADVVVGLGAPATGREQKAGDAMREIAGKIIDGINAKGGILGEAVSLLVADDQCSDAGAIAAANALISKRAKLVIGHPCARAALAAAQVYGPAGIIFIAPANRHPALTDKRAGKSIFRLSGRDDQQASDAADWLLAQPGTGPFAIIHDKTAYSRGLASGVAAALVTKAQPAPLDYPITAGENVYAPVIAKLAQQKPRAVFFAGYPAEADIIVASLRAAGLTAVPVLGSDSLATLEFTTQRAARDAFVEVLTRFPPQETPLPDVPDRGFDPFAGLIDTSWSAPIAAQARNTAGAILSWADACRRAASLSSEVIGPELAAPLTASPQGIASFDEKGDARVSSFYAVRWNGTRWIGKK